MESGGISAWKTKNQLGDGTVKSEKSFRKEQLNLKTENSAMLLIEDRRPVSVSNISKLRICDSSLNIWQPHKSLIFVLDIYLFVFLFFADCIKHIHDPVCYGVRHCKMF